MCALAEVFCSYFFTHCAAKCASDRTKGTPTNATRIQHYSWIFTYRNVRIYNVSYCFPSCLWGCTNFIRSQNCTSHKKQYRENYDALHLWLQPKNIESFSQLDQLTSPEWYQTKVLTVLNTDNKRILPKNIEVSAFAAKLYHIKFRQFTLLLQSKSCK